jgi:Outer membrane protein
MKKYYFLLLTILFPVCLLQSQETPIRLTLKDVIELAQTQSPSILITRHNFRSRYWSYVSYKANYLPSLSLSSTPNFNHWINTVTLSDGTSQYVQQNQLQTDLVMSINQNIAFTGGTLSVQTALSRLDMLDDNTYSYKSTPLMITYNQSLGGYNGLKWDKQIQPIRYEEAKREYVENLEWVAAQAVNRFFNLAMAQTNLEIANVNYANADTLYSFAQGRYNIGTITENEMLQLEVNKLSGESNRLNASLSLDDAMESLRTFLGIKTTEMIEVIIEGDIPLRFVNQLAALREASENSAELLYAERKRLESESNVAYVKGNTGLKADLYMQFGLAQTNRDLELAYRDPLNQQYVQVGFRLPVLDWGRGKGQVEVAKSSRDVVYMQTEQDQITFEMNIKKTVKQFNLQASQIAIAAKADYTAQRRNEIAQKLYMLGKSTILDLNSSVTEKDVAKRAYLNTLQSYWSLYYTLRSMVLFDFEQNIPIAEDYKLLIK